MNRFIFVLLFFASCTIFVNSHLQEKNVDKSTDLTKKNDENAKPHFIKKGLKRRRRGANHAQELQKQDQTIKPLKKIVALNSNNLDDEFCRRYKLEFNHFPQSCVPFGADIVFLFDGSFSITQNNFDKMKQFAKNVVNSFNVGSEATQSNFGFIQYSTNAVSEFYLKTYSSNTSINKAIDEVKFQNGMTYTNLGLDELRKSAFLGSNGARPSSQGHPRVGIVLTDGASNNPSATSISALAAQDAGIIIIAVGVGTNASSAELRAIASHPDCLSYVLQDNAFTYIDSLRHVIERSSCDIPLPIELEDSSTMLLSPGGSQNCKINITKDGVTIEIVALNDATTKFYVSRSGYPSESYFDDSVEASAGHVGLMFIENKLKNGSLDSIFCNIKAGNVGPNIRIGLRPGDGDTCKNSKPCLNNGSCENQPGSSYICACPSDYTGKNCETKTIAEVIRDAYNCADRNPCTQENINFGVFYFGNDDPGKFVQCSERGECFVMSCPAGTNWNNESYTCDFPNQ